MSDLFPAGQHPDADQLNAFAEHALPAQEQQQTLAHLADCAACRQVVALSLPPKEQAQAVTASWYTRWFPGWHLAWAGVPALAVLVLLVAFLRTGKVQRPAGTEMVTTMRAPVPASQPMAAPPPGPPPVASLNRSLHSQRLQTPTPPPAQNPSGVMGGVLGGVGAGPIAVPSPPAAGTSIGPQFALARHSAPAVLTVPVSLPSHLATLSTASQGSQRLAVDTNNQVFFSADDGQHWQTVPPQWQGRAVRVTVAGADTSAARASAVLPRVNAFLAPRLSGASISGTVADATGAVISGATVAVVDTNGTVARAVTDQKGQFRLEHLAKGSYRIEAAAPGFMKQSSMAELAAAQQAVVGLTMQVASAAETVTVQTAPVAADRLSAPAEIAVPGFELITTDGSHWLSADGLSWVRK